jgi:D-psicose/D-tagatose/L-ribulose 3-epimerase
VWTGGWTESDCRHALESTKSLGYDFIEIPLLDPGSIDARMTRRLLEEYELDATCSLGLGFETDISSPDPEIVKRGERLLSTALAATREMGATYLGGVIQSAMGKYVAPATAEGRRNSVEVLRRLADAAKPSGITLGIEAVNRYESNFVNTADEALALVDEIGAGNVVVHLDTYHMNIEEGDVAGPVLKAADRLGYLHVGESHRGYLGSGSIDFERFFRALVHVDYDGPIAFESFSSAVISEAFASALAVWRNLWDDGTELARHAKSFIEEQLLAAERSVWTRGGRDASRA